MNWYLAKLVYRIISGRGEHTPQFEEQLRLVAAPSKGVAFQKASALGRLEDVQFPNEKQELVHWKFINVSEVYQLNDIVDGAELYSRIEEKEEGDAYERAVHARARHLQEEERVGREATNRVSKSLGH